MTDLAMFIKQKRGTRSLHEVSRECGISVSTLSRLEHGGLPSAGVREKLATWLDLDAEVLTPVAWQVEALMRQADIVERELTQLRVMIGALLD